MLLNMPSFTTSSAYGYRRVSWPLRRSRALSSLGVPKRTVQNRTLSKFTLLVVQFFNDSYTAFFPGIVYLSNRVAKLSCFWVEGETIFPLGRIRSTPLSQPPAISRVSRPPIYCLSLPDMIPVAQVSQLFLASPRLW